MSLSWVQWCKNESNEVLMINEKERKAIETNSHVFCGIADDLVKKKVNPNANANDLFEKMPLEQKMDFTWEVLQKGFEILGLRKKKFQDDDNSIAETQGQEMLEAHQN